mgnify:CR=1 FL=1
MRDIDIFAYNLGGPVAPLMRDPQPEPAPINISPAQLANISGGFAFGSGIADMFGEYFAYPTDPEMTVAEMAVGPRGPSLMENIRNREFLDAGLQVAGGIGDLIPPVMAVVGPMRAARAASKVDLPMDEASRAARAEEGGFKTDVFHGSTHDINAFDAELAGSYSDFGPGIYLTDSADDASVHYAGIGPDLKIKVDQTTDFLEDQGMPRDEAFKQAHDQHVGTAREGVVYPLKINTDNFVTIGGKDRTILKPADDYMANAKADVDDYDGGRANFRSDDDYEQAIRERADEMFSNDDDSNIFKLSEFLRNEGADKRMVDDILVSVQDYSGELDEIDATQLIDAFSKNYFMDGYRTSRAMAAEFFRDYLGYEGIIDTTVSKRFSGMEIEPDTKHYIVFEGAEKKIRSKQAKFDPQEASSPDILKAEGGEIFSEMANPYIQSLAQDASRIGRGPMPSPAQITNLASQMTGIGGFFDLFGGMPKMPDRQTTMLEMMQGESNPSFLENVRQGQNLDAGAQLLGMVPGIGFFAKAGIKSSLFQRALDSIKNFTGLSEEARSDAIRGTMSRLYDEDQSALAKEAVNKIADSKQDRVLTTLGVESAEDLVTNPYVNETPLEKLIPKDRVNEALEKKVINSDEANALLYVNMEPSNQLDLRQRALLENPNFKILQESEDKRYKDLMSGEGIESLDMKPRKKLPELERQDAALSKQMREAGLPVTSTQDAVEIEPEIKEQLDIILDRPPER